MSRDDDLDRPSRGGAAGGELGPLDKTFRDTNIVILILFALCCRGIALILGLICMFTAKDPKAKSNATIVVVIDVVLIAILLLLNFLGFLGGLAGGGR